MIARIVTIKRKMIQQIYVALVNEGVTVWRPVLAEQVEEDCWRLLGAQPTDEEWQFQPGEVVRCEKQTRGGTLRMVAVSVAAG